MRPVGARSGRRLGMTTAVGTEASTNQATSTTKRRRRGKIARLQLGLLDIRILLKIRPIEVRGGTAESLGCKSQKSGKGAMEAGWKRGVIEVKAQAADNRKIRLQWIEGGERIRHVREGRLWRPRARDTDLVLLSCCPVHAN